jgi:hypothetical protein
MYTKVDDSHHGLMSSHQSLQHLSRFTLSIISDLGHFLLIIRDVIRSRLLFEPFEFTQASFPIFNMFGPSYNPDTDIPDLSGKVILVTGGIFTKSLSF